MRSLYHKFRFLIKSFGFPKTFLVGDTSNKILIHNWPTSMDIFNGSTIIKDEKMFYEPEEYEYFVKIAKGKKIFFDLGAHIGWYCLVANGLGVEKSYAFEIVDSFADIAEKNFRLNNIKGGVFRVALGIPGEIYNFKQSIYSGTKKTVSLDEFCEAHKVFPDIIKMDIEGSELDVLRSMHNILSRRPALDISVHPAFLKEKGQSDDEVFVLLKKYGYEIIWAKNDTYFME
ncbi:MAG: FkbM family methyltransferase [Patescibacteria group bacterium]